MFEDPPIDAALHRAAQRNNANAAALRKAVEHESAGELAQALDVPAADAGQRMARLRRIVAFTGDWGAGCKLLSDDIRDQLVALFDSW